MRTGVTVHLSPVDRKGLQAIVDGVDGDSDILKVNRPAPGPPSESIGSHRRPRRQAATNREGDHLSHDGDVHGLRDDLSLRRQGPRRNQLHDREQRLDDRGLCDL